jgi:hypothetical protein
VNDFLDDRGFDIRHIKLSDSKDMQIGAELSDLKVLLDFRSFHDERAKLRVVSARGNYQVAAMERKAGIK